MALPTRVTHALLADPQNWQRDFDTMLNRFFNPDTHSHSVAYGVDIREDANNFYVEAELPGFKKEDVNVTFEDQQLTIQAERKEEKREDGKNGETLLAERRWGRYVRSFTLPPTVDASKVDAKLADGVLSITLTKREEVKPRKIAVS